MDEDYFVLTYTRSVCGMPDSDAIVTWDTREGALAYAQELMDAEPVYKGRWRVFELGEEVDGGS